MGSVKMKARLKKLMKKKTLLFMCLPAIELFFVFSYLPMPGV